MNDAISELERNRLLVAAKMQNIDGNAAYHKLIALDRRTELILDLR